MRSKQSGFTLVEIAIVLVIIGLLLGGVLKGQELINSAKVKNMATDFRNIPVFIYGYQDKFRHLPGDDAAAVANVGAVAGHNGDGDGVIEGLWYETDPTTASPNNESVLFWEHVRRANLASGATDFSTQAIARTNLPVNAEGGQVGITGRLRPLTTMNGGSYYVCSSGIDGKFARQLDLTLDDGISNRGSMQAIAGAVTDSDGTKAASVSPSAAGNASGYDDGTRYVACMTY